jgi:membrane protein
VGHLQKAEFFSGGPQGRIGPIPKEPQRRPSVGLQDIPVYPDTTDMKLSRNPIFRLSAQSVASWRADFAPSMGAAIAFYTLFSIAPLLLIVISVAGYFFGMSAARGEIVAQLSMLMGNEGAEAIERLLQNVNESPHRSFITAIGVVVFLVGATSVFNELQDALNRIWRVKPKHGGNGFLKLVRTQLLSFGMILAIAFLLIVSLVVSALMAGLGHRMGPAAGHWALAAQFIEVGLSFILTTVMFALIYKIVPQCRVLWSDVGIGAATTAMLFSVGNLLIGIYLGNSTAVSAFGQLGSFAVFLLWVYYSAQVFLLGAEFTSIYSGTHRPPRPRIPGDAVPGQPGGKGMLASVGAREGT